MLEAHSDRKRVSPRPSCASRSRKVGLEAQSLNHGVRRVAQPGGQTLGTTALGSRDAGQYVSVMALRSF